MDRAVNFLNKRISKIEEEISELYRNYEDGNISDYEYGQRLFELSIRKDELEDFLEDINECDSEQNAKAASCESCSTCAYWEEDEDSHDFSWCWEKEHPTFGIEDCEHYKQKFTKVRN